MGGHQADVAEQGARRASWDDRRVLNGICWVLRSGAPRRDLPDCYGPCITCPHLYRARNLVERFFNKIKQCRRIATRYNKLAANYLAFIQLASIRLWLRVYEFTA